MQRRSTDTLVRRVKLINLEQVKRVKGKPKKNINRGDTIKYRG